MNANGPQTEELRRQVRERDHEYNTRISTLEDQLRIVRYLGTLLGSFVISVSVLVFVGVLNP